MSDRAFVRGTWATALLALAVVFGAAAPGAAEPNAAEATPGPTNLVSVTCASPSGEGSSPGAIVIATGPPVEE